MRHWLDVPYGEKEEAKRCGARWDDVARRWYAPRPGMRPLEKWAARPDLPELLPGEDRSFGSGLFVEPIPATVFFTHARSSIAQQDWERVRRLVTTRAGRRCEACGAAEDRRQAVRMDTHERWDFDIATRTQRLRRLVCFCDACHVTTHFGLAQLQGKDAAAFAHLRDVTGMTEAAAQEHLRDAFALWGRRSEIPWSLDLSLLTEAGVAIVQEAGSGADRARKARAGVADAQDRSQADERVRPQPGGSDAPRPRPVTIADRPNKPGSRWQRWITTGER